jgi:hypothetical protein
MKMYTQMTMYPMKNRLNLNRFTPQMTIVDEKKLKTTDLHEMTM